MTSRNRPLSKSERQELARFVSPAAKVTRAVLWLLVVAIVALVLVSWNINQKTGEIVWWPVSVIAAGIAVYLIGIRMSGGSGLRAQVQNDLKNGEAEERFFEMKAAAIFPEIEDEGPVVFLLSGERVYCLSGQRVSRLVRDHTMASQLVESLAPASRRVLGLQTRGERLTLQKADLPFCPKCDLQSRLSPHLCRRSFLAVGFSGCRFERALISSLEPDQAYGLRHVSRQPSGLSRALFPPPAGACLCAGVQPRRGRSESMPLGRRSVPRAGPSRGPSAAFPFRDSCTS
jgi:hypothetical protein